MDIDLDELFENLRSNEQFQSLGVGDVHDLFEEMVHEYYGEAEESAAQLNVEEEQDSSQRGWSQIRAFFFGVSPWHLTVVVAFALPALLYVLFGPENKAESKSRVGAQSSELLSSKADELSFMGTQSPRRNPECSMTLPQDKPFKLIQSGESKSSKTAGERGKSGLSDRPEESSWPLTPLTYGGFKTPGRAELKPARFQRRKN